MKKYPNLLTPIMFLMAIAVGVCCCSQFSSANEVIAVDRAKRFELRPTDKWLGISGRDDLAKLFERFGWNKNSWHYKKMVETCNPTEGWADLVSIFMTDSHDFIIMRYASSPQGSSGTYKVYYLNLADEEISESTLGFGMVGSTGKN